MSNEIPRRSKLWKYTAEEAAIRSAILLVEEMGAHPLLTEAVILLGQAKDKVSDFVDLKSNSSQNEDATCPDCGSQAEWKDDEDGKETPDGGSYYCPLGCQVKG